MEDNNTYLTPLPGAEDAAPPETYLPQPDTMPPARVPKNLAESAAQFSVALNRPIKDTATTLAMGEINPLLYQLMYKEYQDTIDATKSRVLSYVKEQEAEKAAFALTTGQEATKAQSEYNPDTQGTQGQHTLATRALESQGASFAASRYRDLNAYAEKVDEVSADVAIRNINSLVQNDTQSEPGMLDYASYFFGSLLPFGYGASANAAIAKVIGGSAMDLPYNMIEKLRNHLLGLRPDERKATLEKLKEAPLGLWGDNPVAKRDFFNKLAELERPEANVAMLVESLGLVDVGTAIKGIATLIRKGTPLSAVAKTAGTKKAGEMAMDDLLKKGGFTGLNDAEIVGRVLSMGGHPYTLDPAATVGLAPSALAKLAKEWDDTLASLRSRLGTSTLTPEEMKVGADAIRFNFQQAVDSRIFNATFGEATDEGLPMTVHWQGRSGTFASEEAARAEMEARGMTNARPVTRAEAEAELSSSGTAPIVRAAVSPKEAAYVKGEMASVLKNDVPKLKQQLKEIEAKIDELDINYADYDGGSVHERYNLTQQRDHLRVLIDEAKRVKSSEDMDIWNHNYELMQGWLGHPLESNLNRQGKVATAFDKLIAQSPDKTTNASKVLDLLLTHSEDDAVRVIAKTLKNHKGIDWEKVAVKNRLDDPSRAGVYAPLEDFLNVNKHFATTEETLLHEIVHAHNSQVITLALKHPEEAAKVLTRAQRDAVSELKNLYDRVKGKFADYQHPELQAALEHPDEFLAYGLTNQNVRALLHSMTLKELGYASSESVVSKLWSLFKEVLGFTGNKTALAKLSDSFEKLASTGSEKQRSFMSRQWKENPSDAMARYASSFTEKDARAPKNKVPTPVFKALEKELTKTQKELLKDGLSDADRQALLDRADKLKEELAKLAPDKAPVEEWLIREERTSPYSYDAIGKYGPQDMETMQWLAVDPKHGASELAMEGRVVGVHAEAKTKAALTKFIEPYYKGLGKEGQARVESLLERGDAFSNGGSVGKEFTYMEAMGHGLNEKEALAYLATRQLRMMMYHIRNGEMVRHMAAMGLQEIEIGGVKGAGKILSHAEVGKHVDTWIYDAGTKATKKMSREELYDQMEAGKQLIRLEHPMFVDGQMRQVFFVDDTTTTIRDIKTALHYRPGEYSRIYTDQYFVTIKSVQKVDGVNQEVTRTIRTAPSAREGDEFAKNLHTAIGVLKNTGRGADVRAEIEKLVGRYGNVDDFIKSVDNGEFDGITSIESHYTRNKEEYLNGSIAEAMTNGRLFTSKRADHLFSTDASRPNTLSVYDSLSAEVTNVSRVANINQWRETNIRRWMNTFGHLLPERSGNDVADFYKAAGASFTRGDQESLFAERTHKYIMQQVGMRTAEERFYETLTRRMTEKFLQGNPLIESVGAKIREMGVLDMVRNVNFNLTLGMFNPAQLIVQANGAATALIVSPLHGLAAAKTFPLLRMALMSDREDVWKFFAKAEKGLFGNEEEFVKLVKAVRQTGILDNLQSTALYNREGGVTNIFGGYPNKLWANRNFFFNRGEEFSRLVSFDVARREWIAAHGKIVRQAPPVASGYVRYYHGGSPQNVTGSLWFTSDLNDAKGWASRSKGMDVWYVDVLKNDPVRGGDATFGVLPPSRIELPAHIADKRAPLVQNGADWTSKQALAAMVVRADDLTQNMTRANLANFQKGLVSIPAQFAQYNIKLAANILSSLMGKGEGRGFTKTEALSLLAGHVLLYGAAGNGLMGLLEEAVPRNAWEGMSTDAKTYLAQGLLAGVVNQMGEWATGERTNVALGSRLGSFNYYKDLADAIFTDPKNVYEALMGPSLGTAKRLGVIGEVAALWWKDPELTGQDVLEGLARVSTEQVATLRNAAKAYLYHQHADKLVDKNGVAIAQLTPTEVLAQSLGFSSTAAADVSNLIKSKKEHTEALTDIANLVYKVQKQIMEAHMRGDHAYAEQQHKLLNVLWPTNTGDMVEVQRMVRERLYPYDTEFSKLMGDYISKGKSYDKLPTVTDEPRKER